MIQCGNLLLGPSTNPLTSEQAYEIVSEMYLTEITKHILEDKPMPTDDLLSRWFMYLLPGLDREKILDLNSKFSHIHLNSDEFYSRKNSILAQLLRENLGKNIIVQSIIDYATQFKKKVSYFSRSRDSSFFLQNFAYAIPSTTAIRDICKFANYAQILEVCSGLGLWAALIRANGGNIIPTDSFTSHGTSQEKKFIDVIPIDAVSAVNTFPTPVLMICWPGHGDPCAYESLRAFQGDKLVYIGEMKEGCTANNEFFDLLSSEWDEKNYYYRIPQWYGVLDSLSFYTRKSVTIEDNWTLVQIKKDLVKKDLTKIAASDHATCTSINYLDMDPYMDPYMAWIVRQYKKKQYKITTQATHKSSNMYSILCVNSYATYDSDSSDDEC
jgi:hypothetical protein